MWKRIPAVACLLLGAAGHLHADRAWLRKLNTAPAPLSAPVQWQAPEIPRPERIWLLFLDGLSRSRALSLPGIRALASEGAERELRAEFPSFTWAAITAMSTGMPPRTSGVRLNGSLIFSDLDSVSRRAAAVGWPVSVSEEGLPEFSDLLQLPPGAEVLDREALLSRAPQREIAWIYLKDIDKAGHSHGADSSYYASACEVGDALVSRAAGLLDRERDLLLVVSDHGHLARGGHGGIEPEVREGLLLAVGPGVSPGITLPPAPARDLAPTLALAAGASIPSGSIGLPMLDLWGHPRPEIPPREGRRRRWWAPLLLLPLTLPWLARRLEWRDARPSAAYLIAVALLGLLGGYSWSWSVPRGEVGFTLESAIAALFGLIAARLFCRDDRQAQEAWAGSLLLGGPYLLLAWLAGSPEALGGPYSTFGLILWGTLQIYIGFFLGWRGLRAP